MAMEYNEITLCEDYAKFVINKAIANAQNEIDKLNDEMMKAVKKKKFDDYHSLAIKNIFELRRVIRTLEHMRDYIKSDTSDYIESLESAS